MAHVYPKYTQGIHIIMNRMTGKTLPECFVEFETLSDARKALEMQFRTLKGRPISMTMSNQQELMDALFPNWKPALDLKESLDLLGSDDFLINTNDNTGIYLNREEIQSLLNICKNFKVMFSYIFSLLKSFISLENVPKDRLNQSFRFYQKCVGTSIIPFRSFNAIISLKCSRVSFIES